jgi:hypothetical protein
MGRTRRTEYAPLPDAEETFFAGKTLLTASAVVEMRLISQVGEEAPEELQVMIPAPVGQAVDPDGVQARVTEQDFEQASCRRVSIKDRPDVFPNCPEHATPFLP